MRKTSRFLNSEGPSARTIHPTIEPVTAALIAGGVGLAGVLSQGKSKRPPAFSFRDIPLQPGERAWGGIGNANLQGGWQENLGYGPGGGGNVHGALSRAAGIGSLYDYLGYQEGRAANQQGRQDLLGLFGGVHNNLQPTINQGRGAEGELAAMLGVPGADGRRQPYDLGQLAQTPGFQFQQEWGMRALENSAVGSALSGNQAREALNFGQGLASNYFNQRVTDLGLVADRGVHAQGNYANAGAAFGGLFGQQSFNLQDLARQHGTRQSETITDLGSSQTNLELARATGESNQNIAYLNARAQERAAKTAGIASIFSAGTKALAGG